MLSHNTTGMIMKYFELLKYLNIRFLLKILGIYFEIMPGEKWKYVHVTPCGLRIPCFPRNTYVWSMFWCCFYLRARISKIEAGATSPPASSVASLLHMAGTEIIHIYLLLPIVPKDRRGIVVTYKAAMTATHSTQQVYVSFGHWISTGILMHI